MYNNSKIAKAIRVAMMFGAGAAAAISAPTFAADEGVEEVERIQVTGSRLKRTDMESASPITVISAEQLKVQGIQDVGQFLQNSAVMSGSPAMTTTNNGGSGGTFVELRGLGASRTLVLVNGRRPVTSDFQSIPASMIDRIEVLKDGASATYGADAVAGVVNIITRRDFEGVEINVQTKGSFDVDTNNQDSFSIVMGKAFDDGHLVFGVDYVEQEAVYQGDTSVDFLNYPWQVWGEEGEDSFWKNGLIGGTGDDANIIVVGSGSVPCGNFYFQHGSSQTNDKCDGGIAQLGDMRDFNGSGPGNDTYNYAPVNFLQTPYKKLNVFVEGSFELNDNISLYTETRINKRTSRQELAAVPYDTRFDPAYSGTYGKTLVDGTPVLGDDDKQVMVDFNGVSKDNFYNPFGEDVTRSRRRMLEGGRSFEQDIVGVQQVIGMEGEFGDGWSYDLNYNYGYQQTTSTDFGQLYGPNLSKAMGPSFEDENGNIVCGTTAEPIVDCVSMNVFGGAPGSVTKEMLDYVSAPLVDASNYTLQTLTGFVGGDLLELPAGPLTAGVGFEWRSEKAEAQVDSGKFMSEVTGNKSKGTNGSYDVTSLFTEIRIPVLADLPFADRLEIPVGIRYDDFSAFGSEVTYQVGVEWNVMDGLLVRGTYGTVFRAPSIGSLYGPESDSFPSSTDPCSIQTWDNLEPGQQANCQAGGVPAGGSANLDSQQLSASGGNPDLTPESGDTFTIGLAYSPHFAEGLGLTLDYWAIELEDVIDAVSASDTLKGCYLGGVASLCENIQRTNGELSYLSEKSSNLSAMTAKGIDFEANYGFEALAGNFNFNLSWSHFLERENQVYNSTTFAFEMQDLNGLFENDATYATDKAVFNASYTWQELTISYATNYLSGTEYDTLLYWETTPNDPNDISKGNHMYQVDSHMYHDLTATYNFVTNTTVSIGVTNLTDEQPPYIEPGNNGNTDESVYRLFGVKL
jgi:iron complex outermembrane receptor protein